MDNNPQQYPAGVALTGCVCWDKRTAFRKKRGWNGEYQRNNGKGIEVCIVGYSEKGKPGGRKYESQIFRDKEWVQSTTQILIEPL